VGSRVQQYRSKQTNDEVYAMLWDQDRQEDAEIFIEYCVQSYKEGYKALNWFSYVTSEQPTMVLCRIDEKGNIQYKPLSIQIFMQEYQQVA